MKITIISDNKRWRESIQRYLDRVLSGLDFDKDIFLIDVNYIELESDKRLDLIGIKIAEEKYNENVIIILMSFSTEKYLLANNLQFRGLISRSNVGFIRVPFYLNEIEKEIRRIISGSKKEDTTAYALYLYENQQKILAQLQHNMSWWIALETERSKAIQKAREAGLTGTDKEVLEQIKEWKRDNAGSFKGKTLEGVFVDALDTLFNSEWNLNENVLERVNKIAEETGKKLFIISDSEEEEVKRAAKKANISWQLLSKFILRGATLEIVIDNLSEKEFKEKYNINPQKFITVSKL